MKIRSGLIKQAAGALSALLGPGNRIDVLALLRTERNLRVLVRAHEGFEVLRHKLLKEHGATLRGGARAWTFPTPEAKGLFDLAFSELANAEQELELEPIEEKDIVAGFYRHPPTLPDGETNPDAGKREPLDWDGQHFLLLRDLGIVTGKSVTTDEIIDSAVELLEEIDRALGIDEAGDPVPDLR